MNEATMLFSSGSAIIIAIILDILLFILGICVCFAIISMSKSLKDIRNLYFRMHWDEVEKARKEDAMEKAGLNQNDNTSKM